MLRRALGSSLLASSLTTHDVCLFQHFELILIPFPNSVPTSLIASHFLVLVVSVTFIPFISVVGGGSQEEVGMKAFFLSLSHLATSPNIVFWEQLFTLDCIGRLSISVCYCN